MTDQICQFSEQALAVLNALPFHANARFFYEHLSGGFVWSDDFPSIDSPEWTVVSHDCLYRYMIRIRRCITLGDMALESHPLWRQVVSGAPDWPGLKPDRRSARIAKKLRAAERIAERCYKKLSGDAGE